MTQYAISTLAGRVLGFAESDTMPVLHDAGRIAHVMVTPVPGWPTAPTATSELWVSNGELRWVEAGLLDECRAECIAKTYRDVDAVYEAAIGKREPEYVEAESVARAYLAADPKPAIVSDYITAHAANNATGLVQTNDWAAQQIVERADAFRWAKLQMRTMRFTRQRDMRTATTHEALNAAVAQWEGFITWLRSTLGL